MSTIHASSAGSSLSSLRMYAGNARAFAGVLQSLASGSLIRSGADNPAGLIAAQMLSASMAELDAQSQSLTRAYDVAGVADGALQETSDLLGQAKTLALANANEGGLTQAERQANQLQIDSILSSVDRIANTTTFAGQRLLDGTFTLTVGQGSLAVDAVTASQLGRVDIDGKACSVAEVGTGKALNIVDGDADGAAQAIGAAITQVATLRGRLGAMQSQTIDSLRSSVGVTFQNLSSAYSVIHDTDYAQQLSSMVRLQVLQRASLSMMSLLNASAANAMSLLWQD